MEQQKCRCGQNYLHKWFKVIPKSERKYTIRQSGYICPKCGCKYAFDVWFNMKIYNK